MKVFLRLLSAMLVIGLFFLFTACGQYDEAKTEGEGTEYAEGETQDSNRGTASATFGTASVSVNYGRPQLEGRDMLGQASDGMVWRMGMNDATTISTGAALTFGETVIPAGEYSLWMKKVSADTWELVFNSQTGQWGTAHDPEQDVAAVPMMISTGEESVETFTVEVTAENETTGSISAMWGTSTLKCDFTVGGMN